MKKAKFEVISAFCPLTCKITIWFCRVWFCGKQHLDKSWISKKIPKLHALCVQCFHSIRKGAEDQFFKF